jgi:hypothetical protein
LSFPVMTITSSLRLIFAIALPLAVAVVLRALREPAK